jgi:hypothetical protein
MGSQLIVLLEPYEVVKSAVFFTRQFFGGVVDFTPIT